MKEYTIEFGTWMMRYEYYNMDSFAGKIGLQLARGKQLGWICFDQSDLLDPALSSQMSFLRSAAKCRRAGKDFLLYGEFLRPPDLASAGAHKTAWFHGSDDNIEVPNIMAGTYKAENGDIGIVLVNVTNAPEHVSVPVNEKDWGLKIEGAYDRSIWQDDSWSSPDGITLGKTISAAVPAYSPMIIRLRAK